ncbi:MAG: hypothetical protein IIB04_04845 [Acidobacteria bacterium]|nr:hypothetical protein [Acidobacteriota bacterium]
MDDIDEALTKLEGLAAMQEKLKDASARMEDTLSKLNDGDKKEEEEGEGD